MIVRRRRRVGAIAVVVTVAILAAACSPGTDVSTDSADTIITQSPTTDVAVGDPTATDPSTTVSESSDLDSLLPAAGELPSLSTPDPGTLTGTLDNGLRYMIRANDNPGEKVELRLAVDAGSVLEDESQLGGAHFLEHMLFNGTERFPKNELTDELREFGAAFGADVNASTGYDDTTYRLTVPNSDDAVETGLDIFEQWLSAATVDPIDVEEERGVVLDEWRSRSQTAGGRIAEQLSDFVLDGTSYEDRQPIGGRDAIETITPQDLRRFYDDWYRPDLTSVIVVGEIDPEEVEDWIIERFSSAESRGADPERLDVAVEPDGTTNVAIVDDPDLAEGSVGVMLPLPVDSSGSIEEREQRSMLDSLAFDVIANRLDGDALRGVAPFERAGADSVSIVRGLDAPGIVLDADGDAIEESLEAVVDEFERVERFGITQGELDRALAARRSAADRLLAGEGSRQDASYAAEYVRHVLEGEWYVTAAEEFAFIDAVLDAATPETVAAVFVDRYELAGLGAFVTVPSDETAAVPGVSALTAIIDGADRRDIEPRPDDAAVDGELIDRPAPVDVVNQYRLVQFPTPTFGPEVVEFDNGVTVAFNHTTIVEGQVYFEGRSPGGSNAVADADVADAQAVGPVLADSGLGSFDRVQLDAFQDDKDMSFDTAIGFTIDSMGGTSSTVDLETLMQFVHVTMTSPRADDAAVDRYVDDRLPFAENPSIDAGYAGTVALLDARYGDAPRFLLPTPDALESVDASGVERVASERFGDASDWSFSFSGDFDVATAIELARSYLGTLPAGEPDDVLDFAEPAPPSGEVVTDVTAGRGDTANVSFLFTSSATADRSDDVVAAVVAEVVDNRLRDVIREELGDSYSPSAAIDLGGGPRPIVETYVTVSTAPEAVDEVSATVLAELESLRVDGPSEREFDNAVATVRERLNFVSNGQINDEILAVLVDPEGNPSFDDFVEQAELVDDVTRDGLQDAIREWIPATEYIEVRVTPEA